MTDLNEKQENQSIMPAPNSESESYGSSASTEKNQKLKISIGVLIVIIIAAVAIIAYNHTSNLHPTTTVTTTVSPAPNTTTNTTITTTAPVALYHEPVTYLTANAFMLVYNFSSPLKYQFKSAFQPYTTDANCTGFEGLIGYMQNPKMITNAYNISTLSKSLPIAEYAAVEGVNPLNIAGYKTLFLSNGGFCRSEMSTVMSESSVSRSKYTYGNTTVYFFEISNMSANATEQFGSYLGPKPNMTIYMAEAMYGNYIIKATSAGFSHSTGALNLSAYTHNLENSTINAFESYLASHPNDTG